MKGGALIAIALAFLLGLTSPGVTATPAQAPQTAPVCLHGHWETDAAPGALPVCVCDNPQPGRGEWGWGGTYCDMRVFGGTADGRDLTRDCKDRHCAYLAPDEWMCFDVPFATSPDPDRWNHLTVQLARTSENATGDPDLYGMWYGGSGSHKRLGRATYGYDFRETSSAGHATVVKRVDKRQYDNFDYQGVYLCVRAYGVANVTFSLRATLSVCPAGFTEAGDQLVCSSPRGGDAASQRYRECTPEGQCVCTPPYDKPVPAVYQGLGFEDCSASVERIEQFETPGNKTFIATAQKVGPVGWHYYAFKVTDDDYEVVVDVSAEAGDNCTDITPLGVYAKFGQPPGLRYGQFDFRPRWSAYADPAERGRHTELRFSGNSPGWQTGDWYLGLLGDGSRECRVTLGVSKFRCPGDCSGRGACVAAANGTRACDCHKGFFGEDCSRAATKLRFGTNFTQSRTTFEYDFFDLPAITPAMLTHNVEVRVLAAFESDGYGSWSTARPELLLLKGDVGSEPSVNNYTFRQALQNQNTTYEIDLCPSQLKQGVWRAALYNPMGIYRVGYNLSVSKQAHCLNDCSGHGTCTEDGVCRCMDDWAGGDCSVLPKGGCQQGTRRAFNSGEGHGTCWQECRCDEGGSCAFDTSACADFSCEGSAWRRKGSANECVRDACTQDEYQVADDHTCLRACVCPSDGAACTLAAECRPDAFECRPGYSRAGDGATKCHLVGCKEGSLQEAIETPVDNGRAFAKCLCSAEEGSEDASKPRCRFAKGSATQEGMVVACDAGYRVQGGACFWHGSGMRPLGVVLWTFFGLAVGLVGGIVAHWYYKKALGAKGAPEALYHELSLETGF